MLNFIKKDSNKKIKNKVIYKNSLLNNFDNSNSQKTKKLFSKKENISNNNLKLFFKKPVVHIKHGIGIYMGLEVLNINGVESEYIKILYADDDKLYIPVSSIHLIHVYSEKKIDNLILNKLGNNSWLRTKQKAIEKIHDVAVELLEVYSKRKSKSGYAFQKVEKQYNLFCKQFPFKTTIDQERVINEVLNDMYKPISMDRLICGDVGFGKTEVAMRAAFIAIKNKKQVAVLVPTTLLAQQHFNNFYNRFLNWKISIEMLSRFCSFKEQKNIFEKISLGKIDILIGTHKILKNKIKWFNLGLLIIDEEHRFGVRDKENIKKLKNNIDILTLTATPIPRTLNMALNKIRDLSIIATPPAQRLSIKTFVCQYNVSIIRKAILKEISRGGQIYYLYNDIENIEKAKNRLKKLIPEAQIEIGHGKMKEKDLEQIMKKFINRNFNVLLCTTIIETGIDIPTANTIIIERADQFGLAQLYQLRGRVGRSNHQAYAWFLTPHPKMISQNAHKRLEAISNLENLGSGFTLSTQDLEIRGTGELLGEAQSGQIESIGFSLYTKLLKNAILSLKKNKKISLNDIFIDEPEIEIHVPALFPNTFISDINIRLSIYQKISYISKIEELKNLKFEIINKFGVLPDSACNFFILAELKLYCKIIGIKRIESTSKSGFIEFHKKNKLNIKWVSKLLSNNQEHFKIKNLNLQKLQFQHPDLISHKNRIKWIYSFIKKILKNSHLI